MPPAGHLVVETKAFGMWRVRLVGRLLRFVPRRYELAAANWAARRVTVGFRSPGGRWRREPMHFEFEGD